MRKIIIILCGLMYYHFRGFRHFEAKACPCGMNRSHCTMMAERSGLRSFPMKHNLLVVFFCHSLLLVLFRKWRVSAAGILIFNPFTYTARTYHWFIKGNAINFISFREKSSTFYESDLIWELMLW